MGNIMINRQMPKIGAKTIPTTNEWLSFDLTGNKSRLNEDTSLAGRSKTLMNPKLPVDVVTTTTLLFMSSIVMIELPLLIEI